MQNQPPPPPPPLCAAIFSIAETWKKLQFKINDLRLIPLPLDDVHNYVDSSPRRHLFKELCLPGVYWGSRLPWSEAGEAASIGDKSVESRDWRNAWDQNCHTSNPWLWRQLTIKDYEKLNPLQKIIFRGWTIAERIGFGCWWMVNWVGGEVKRWDGKPAQEDHQGDPATIAGEKSRSIPITEYQSFFFTHPYCVELKLMTLGASAWHCGSPWWGKCQIFPCG